MKTGREPNPIAIGQNDAHDHIVRGFSLNMKHKPQHTPTHANTKQLVYACNTQQIGLIGSTHNNKRNQLYLLCHMYSSNMLGVCHSKSPHTHSYILLHTENQFENFFFHFNIYWEVLHTKCDDNHFQYICDGLDGSLLVLNCVYINILHK